MTLDGGAVLGYADEVGEHAGDVERIAERLREHVKHGWE